MPARSFTVALGAIAANAATGVSLDDRREYSPHARIAEAVVANNSDATLTLANLPGSPTLDPGERPEVEVGGRTLQISADAAVAAGQVRVTVRVEDDCCGL